MAADRPMWSRPELAVLGALLALIIAIPMAGCFGRAVPTPSLPAAPPLSRPVLDDPETPLQAADRRVADLEGQLAAEKSERSALRLAPLRTSLLWCQGLAILAIVGGAALAVATSVWGLGFGLRPCLGIVAAGVAALAACLGADWALDHVRWVIAALAMAVVGCGLWLMRGGSTFLGAVRQAWEHVPDDAPTPPQVDALLDRLSRKRAR